MSSDLEEGGGSGEREGKLGFLERGLAAALAAAVVVVGRGMVVALRGVVCEEGLVRETFREVQLWFWRWF